MFIYVNIKKKLHHFVKISDCRSGMNMEIKDVYMFSSVHRFSQLNIYRNIIDGEWKAQLQPIMLGEQFIIDSKFEGNRWWMLQLCWVNQWHESCLLSRILSIYDQTIQLWLLTRVYMHLINILKTLYIFLDV